MPFGASCEYPDFEACVAANGDKANPSAYCATLMEQTEGSCQRALGVQRAYSVLSHIKSVDDDARLIEGIASTPEADRVGDVVESTGATFKLPMPLLWQHRPDEPIGRVLSAKVTKSGIQIRAQIAKNLALPEIDRAWALIKAGLVRGLSIGFRALEMEPLNPKEPWGAQRFKKWEWLELSAVTIPANAQASISLIKQYDTHRPAASGTGPARPSTPGVSGLSTKVTAMNVSEQLTTERAALQLKNDRLQALFSQDQAHGLEEDEVTERDTLSKEIPALTAKVQQLVAMEAAQAALAGGLKYPAPVVPISRSHVGATRVEVPPRPKGQIFIRYAMALAAGRGSISDTLAYAKNNFSGTPEVVHYIKALHLKAVEGTPSVASPAWGGELVNPQEAETEFVELLRAETIIGKIQGLRGVPFNIPIITQTGGSTFAWVGVGGTKPVSELSFTRDFLTYSKAAGIVVLAEELVRLSRPDAEQTVLTDMIEQCTRFLDQQFVDPTVAASANNPASITNGVASPAATGADLDSFKLDFFTALQTFTAAGIPLSGLVVITTPNLALGISMFTNALGQTPVGINVTPNGGTLYGYPVIPSDNVPAGTMIIAKPSEIFLADDGRVTLDASREATLDMFGGSPSAPGFSLWQRNCVGIRAERWIRWQARRTGAVAIIDTASYGPSATSP